MLKQAKRSFTKNCYTKLTPAQRCENLQVLNPCEHIVIHNNLFLPVQTKPNSLRQSFARQTF